MSQLSLPAMLRSTAAQGSYLSPSQVARATRESSARLIRSNPDMSFRRGLGDSAQGTWLSPRQVPARERLSAARMVAAQQFFGMGAGQFYVPGTKTKINMPKICDKTTGTCISYAAPKESVVKTAYTQGKFQLPAFYSHPTLGPWGVDPLQAYNYWAYQQAATQASPYGGATPMTVWGSPGAVVAQPAAMTPSRVAQPAAFDPYTQAFPTAGTAVERF